jgi:hypothetical protein
MASASASAAPVAPPGAPAGELARLHELAASAREGRRLWMRFALEAHAAGDAVGLRTYLAGLAWIIRKKSTNSEKRKPPSW